MLVCHLFQSAKSDISVFKGGCHTLDFNTKSAGNTRQERFGIVRKKRADLALEIGNVLKIKWDTQRSLAELSISQLEDLHEAIVQHRTEKVFIPQQKEIKCANLLYRIVKSANIKGRIDIQREYNVRLSGLVLISCMSKAKELYAAK